MTNKLKSLIALVLTIFSMTRLMRAANFMIMGGEGELLRVIFYGILFVGSLITFAYYFKAKD